MVKTGSSDREERQERTQNEREGKFAKVAMDKSAPNRERGRQIHLTGLRSRLEIQEVFQRSDSSSSEASPQTNLLNLQSRQNLTCLQRVLKFKDSSSRQSPLGALTRPP